MARSGPTMFASVVGAEAGIGPGCVVGGRAQVGCGPGPSGWGAPGTEVARRARFSRRSVHTLGGPGMTSARSCGGLGKDLDLRHRARALANSGRDAVHAGVGSADDDHVAPSATSERGTG